MEPPSDESTFAKFLVDIELLPSLNLLLVRSHQAELIIVKRLMQRRNNVTRLLVELRSRDKGRRKNAAFCPSTAPPTSLD